MQNPYQRLPQQNPLPNNSFVPSNRSRADFEDRDAYGRRLRAAHEAEFNRPPPAWWKRTLLIVGLIFMFWLSVYLGRRGMKKSQVIYASRYSEEFKYRPAASPVITEYLPDGRIRVRGASVGGVGVREEDIPLTPAQKKQRDQKRREEARDRAREKMGLKTKKAKKDKRGKNNVDI
ncbi:hypothetical protein L204_100052 [Cryptococcus depauperatus]|nr:hypothetical protein L204_02467 [Cryptococcus depauperatus CBS 7855]